jgi:hypothetical protein
MAVHAERMHYSSSFLGVFDALLQKAQSPIVSKKSPKKIKEIPSIKSPMHHIVSVLPVISRFASPSSIELLMRWVMNVLVAPSAESHAIFWGNVLTALTGTQLS